MARQTAKVEIDLTRFRGYMVNLQKGLTVGCQTATRAEAERVAQRTRDVCPVDTGALLGTIGAVPTYVAATRRSPGGEGWGVTYGRWPQMGRYPYVVNNRQRVIKRAARGARTSYAQALDAVAANTVRRVG